MLWNCGINYLVDMFITKTQTKAFAGFLLDIGKGLFLGSVAAIFADPKTDPRLITLVALAAVASTLQGLYFYGKLK